MEPSTPILPTVIITHPTPLPPVPRRIHYETSLTSSYISSFFPSDPLAASGSTNRRGSEKLDHALLAPFPYNPGSSRRRKTKRHQTAVQVGLLFLAAILLFTSTRWKDEWAGRGMMGLFLPSPSIPDALGASLLDAWNGDAIPETTSEPEMTPEDPPAPTAQMAMSAEEWKAYIESQQSMTGHPGPETTMEAWAFH